MRVPLLDASQKAVTHSVGLWRKDARHELKERRDVVVEFPEVPVNIGVQPDQVRTVDGVGAGSKHGRLDKAVEVRNVNPARFGGGDNAVKLFAHVFDEALRHFDKGRAHKVCVHGLVLQVPDAIAHIEAARAGKRFLAAASIVAGVALAVGSSAAKGVVDGDDDYFGRVEAAGAAEHSKHIRGAGYNGEFPIGEAEAHRDVAGVSTTVAGC